MFEIILWILALVLFTLSLVSKENKLVFISLIFYFTVFIAAYGGYLLLRHSLLKGELIGHPLLILPFNLQILYVAMFLYFVSFVFNYGQLDEWFGGNMILPVIIFISGSGYIIGALFFGYHWIQYLTGSHFWLVGLLGYIAEKQKKGQPLFFQITAVLLVLYLAGYMYLFSNYIYGSVNLTHLTYSVINQAGVLIITGLYFIMNFAKHNFVELKNRSLLFKTYLILFLANFLYFHPNIDIAQLPILKEIFKYSIVSADIGIVGLCLGITIIPRRNKNI